MSAPVWWWLSFASEKAHLGIALVKAPSFGAAVRESHRLRCNPGGEVAGWPFPADLGDPNPKWIGRVLDRDEADAMSREWTRHPIVSAKDYNIRAVGAIPESDNEGS